jgi:hypothetical protein
MSAHLDQGHERSRAAVASRWATVLVLAGLATLVASCDLFVDERDEASLDPVFEEAVAEATALLGDREDDGFSLEWDDRRCRFAHWRFEDMAVGVQAVEKVNSIGVSAGLEMTIVKGRSHMEDHYVRSADTHEPPWVKWPHLRATAEDPISLNSFTDPSKPKPPPAVYGILMIEVCAY